MLRVLGVLPASAQLWLFLQPQKEGKYSQLKDLFVDIPDSLSHLSSMGTTMSQISRPPRHEALQRIYTQPKNVSRDVPVADVHSLNMRRIKSDKVLM